MNDYVTIYHGKNILIGIICLVLILGACGCAPPEKLEPDPDKYACLVSVAIGVTCLGGVDYSPDFVPTDDEEQEDDVVDPESPDYKDCENCDGNGYLGDATTKTDCPACDYDGDGDKNDDNFGQAVKVADSHIKSKDNLKNKISLNPRSIYRLKPTKKIRFFTNTQDAIVAAKKLDKEILVVLSKVRSKLWDNLIVRDFIGSGYVVLYGDTSDQLLESAWASRARESPLTEASNGKASFTTNVVCVLSSDGKFTKNADSAFIPIKDGPMEFIESIQQYSHK